MKVSCRVRTRRPNSGVKSVIEIDDDELEGLRENEKIDVINRYFHKWLWNTIDAEWEIEEK